MEKTVVKYVKGLSDTATAWERRNHKKYGGLLHICRQIEYDLKHGVTAEQLDSLLHKVRNHSSFSILRKSAGSIERLEEIESHFARPKIRAT